MTSQAYPENSPPPPHSGGVLLSPQGWGIGGVFIRCGVPVCVPAQAGRRSRPTCSYFCQVALQRLTVNLRRQVLQQWQRFSIAGLRNAHNKKAFPSQGRKGFSLRGTTLLRHRSEERQRARCGYNGPTRASLIAFRKLAPRRPSHLLIPWETRSL